MKFEKINLRALEPEDLELLYRWENDTAYWIISNTVSPFSKYTLKRYMENSHKSIYESGQLRLMIELTETKKPIGTIDIFDFDPFHKRAGLGILIADAGERKKGYASMALKCLIDYCFSVLQLHQVYCSVLATNCESRDLFVKLGFTETGLKKEWVKGPKGFLDEHFLQLLNPEVN
jgi:diamine N-acetyltransferase